LPFVQKAYQSNMPQQNYDEGPKVEEVD